MMALVYEECTLKVANTLFVMCTLFAWLPFSWKRLSEGTFSNCSPHLAIPICCPFSRHVFSHCSPLTHAQGGVCSPFSHFSHCRPVSHCSHFSHCAPFSHCSHFSHCGPVSHCDPFCRCSSATRSPFTHARAFCFTSWRRLQQLLHADEEGCFKIVLAQLPAC